MTRGELRTLVRRAAFLQDDHDVKLEERPLERVPTIGIVVMVSPPQLAKWNERQGRHYTKEDREGFLRKRIELAVDAEGPIGYAFAVSVIEVQP